MQEENQKNIQKFLIYFKKAGASNKLSFNFRSNPRVYAAESHLPDLWLKSLIPIDRNEAFPGNPKNKFRKSSKCFEKEKNMFPKRPFIIPNDKELASKNIKVEKINVDRLFESDKNLELEESFLDKDWVVSFYSEDNNYKYGPISSFRMYLFLQNMYICLPEQDRLKKNILIADYLLDVHFLPDTLYELLSQEFGKGDFRIILKNFDNVKTKPKIESLNSDNKEDYSTETCSVVTCSTNNSLNRPSTKSDSSSAINISENNINSALNEIETVSLENIITCINSRNDKSKFGFGDGRMSS